jgi:hypothetical protein
LRLQRVSPMDSRSSVWGLTTQFDGFLFAPVCEDSNGLQLSVLTTLARINRDPWKEAARLAAMPRANAEMSLVTSLQLAAANGWDPSQANRISARLVALLPRADETATVAPEIRKAHARRSAYWLLWLGLMMMMSLLSAHNPATTNDTNVSTTNSTASIPAENSGSNGINDGDQQ